MPEQIRERLAEVSERIADAAARAGRAPNTVTLVAVTKTINAATVQTAVDAGLRDFGENRVQEAVDKIPSVSGESLRWHLIGHLQSNKARLAVLNFDMIHTVDSPALVARLDRIAGEVNRRPSLLVQVDLGHEATKSGAEERQLSEIVRAMDEAHNVEFVGLMTLPPFFEDPEKTRPYFRRLNRLIEEINAARPAEKRVKELSMGMSHDFEVAIEEGATIVRVGTAIFGERTHPAATVGA
jgi:pyridoxal phosphate enzyme (YggS family)